MLYYMDSLTKRNFLFLFGCIGTRLMLTYAAYKVLSTTSVLKVPLILFTLAVSIGFFSIYIFGLRKTGVEVGGNLIWWNDLRPVHGSLYLLFTLLAIKGYDKAYIILLIDTLIGLTAFGINRLL